MNIFEQYGIKEVADVTLYAIELDKYDDEVYIPIMYFDTLKVSTIEQTAEQTSARGGLGNPELIIWDYGKEITVTLEDALFSPASQSLMWGGKFGIKHSKIYGVWNPFIYPKDQFGRTKFISKQIAEAIKYQDQKKEDGYFYPLLFDSNYNDDLYPIQGQTEVDNMYIIYNESGEIIEDDYSPNLIRKEEGWYPFFCCIDNKLKYVRYVENEEGQYKYYRAYETKEGRKQDQFISEKMNCPKGKQIFENGIGLTKYSEKGLLEKTNWANEALPELAEIIIDNFGDFSFERYVYNLIEKNDETICESIPHKDFEINSTCANALGYIWIDTDLKMNSLQGDQDSYLLEGASVKFRTPANSSNKQVMISTRKLYETEYIKEEDNKGEWVFSGTKEIKKLKDLKSRYNNSGTSYGWKKDEYSSKVDFYKNVSWCVPNSNETYLTRILVGTFYIIEDWNWGESPQSSIWPIDDGLEKVPLLETMQKCKATQTFCINTDKNLILGNYRHMKKYSQTPLSVFIDPKTMKPYEPNSNSFIRQNGEVVNGNLRIIKQNEFYYKWIRARAPKYTTLGHRIIVDAVHFPGTYRLVGETYARDRDTGKDTHYQFEIPLAKMSSNNNLTLQADGDPTTFTMTLKVLRREDGVMMKLTQYVTSCQTFDGYGSGSKLPVPLDSAEDLDEINIHKYEELIRLKMIEPHGETYNVNYEDNIKTITPEVILKKDSISTDITYDGQTLKLLKKEKVEKSSEEKLSPNDYTIDIEEVE